MKKFLTIPVVVLSICLLLNFTLQSPQVYAHQHEHSNDSVFQINADGTIQVNGLVFKNFPDYFNSDYFKKSGKRCGTTINQVNSKDSPLASTSDCSLYQTVIRSEYWPSGTYTIPVVFHIIHKNDGTGNISDQRVYDQVDVLNEDFGAVAGSLGENGFDTKIQFQLVDITRTANNIWFNDQSEYQFKSQLGWDQDRYLNVYTNSASGYLGYSTLPQGDAGSVYDGVVVLYETVGGRGVGPEPYNQGRTLVHEIGHYLGLLHTFEGYGCYTGYKAGDLIADTKSENDEHYGCTQTYSCGTPDPIHNYLNYTDDLCMNRFTQEQANRMICALVNYRPLLYDTGSTQPSITVTSPNGGESWSVGSKHSITWTSTGSVGNVKIEYTVNNGSSWSTVVSSTANDGTYSWLVPNTPSSQCKVRVKEASDGSPADSSNAVFTITPDGSGGSPALSVNRTALYYTAVSPGVKTGSQEIWISNSGSGTLNWSVSKYASWLACSPASGSNAGIVTVTINPSTLGAGTYLDTITVSAAGVSNSPQTVAVTLTIKSAAQAQVPFGDFATPVNGSTVRSSIPVTGWALDDIDVQSVKIYNGSSYVGDAVFVEGARPDVEQAYPGYPKNYRAGWGYMLLTNMLPDGTHWISAKVTDNSGNQVNLGSKKIIIDNANAVKPFGAIDTPPQGGSASGVKYRNQGWALTPQPNKIPVNGSTIKLYVDGKYLGTATYNIYRADIAALFPGYANSNGALAYFQFDTTAFENGVHTIQWAAADNAGNTDGIGSRYFTIQNSGNRQQANSSNSPGIREQAIGNLANIPVDDRGPIELKIGYNENIRPQAIYSDRNGYITIAIKELQRVEIDLGQSNWLGFQEIGDQFRSLPVGSHLEVESGIFSWTPGPAFLGDYSLVFINSNTNTLKRINIRILPRFHQVPEPQ